MVRIITFLQGFYYLLTGLWPIIHVQSFMEVTGYKAESWLLKIVGVITVSISLLLILTAVKRKLAAEDLILVISACVSFATMDIINAIYGTISYAYFADAVVQVIFLFFWVRWIIQIRFKSEMKFK